MLAAEGRVGNTTTYKYDSRKCNLQLYSHCNNNKRLTLLHGQQFGE